MFKLSKTKLFKLINVVFKALKYLKGPAKSLYFLSLIFFTEILFMLIFFIKSFFKLFAESI